MNCSAILENDVLILENSRIRREYAWNHGHLISRALVDKQTGHAWDLIGEESDCALPNENGVKGEGVLDVSEYPGDSVSPPHLRADITAVIGGIEIRRTFRIYPDCPAIASDFYLRGTSEAQWTKRSDSVGDLGNIEDFYKGDRTIPAPIMERIVMASGHRSVETVQFYDVTDWRNNLVATHSILPYTRTTLLNGNLLLLRNSFDRGGLFILKEGPCSDVQLAPPGFDFFVTDTQIALVGLGVDSDDVTSDGWTRCYGCVTGVADSSEEDILFALREYQDCLRIRKPGRDHMIMLNTWGDRGQDGKISESFCLAELEAGHQLGITHFQIDDGWQSGQSSNSAFAGGSLENIWERDDYWVPHPDRFPNGLDTVLARAKELGIELCLWFNPSADDDYANWERDADSLIGLYEKYGIRTFKIDGVKIFTKLCDIRMRAFLDKVCQATNNEAVFNLDVTASRRYGYHYFNTYGNIFVENRYTDMGSYYPHRTLRNLWMLSRYVPAQLLQFEFLNVWRNRDKYADDDPLAPGNVPFDYAFATTMMSQPLAWFEGTGLPDEAFDIAPMIRTYLDHQIAIHGGTILPIGEEPSGASWTGFQSVGEQGGYIAIYRELTDRPSARMKLWKTKGARLSFTLIAGKGADFEVDVDASGDVEFALPDEFSFGLYKYSIKR
jgi:alpha-galactosidase